MSAAVSHDWYDLNSTRRWPVDDSASATADDGTVLPDNVVVDASIRVPSDLCSRVMISSVTLSMGAVSVTLVGGDGGFAPVGAVTVARPVQLGRPYPIKAMSDGVAGWVVFGSGTSRVNTRLRFSTPAQGLLAPKIARSYRPLPIPSLGKAGLAIPLTGVVRLRGGTDLEVVGAERLIDGTSRTCAVVRLRTDTTRNLYDTYKGPCGGRPESGTCDRPGVEFFNDVGPDCDGNINISFRDPLRPTFYEGGVAVDYPYGLIDACTHKDRLADADGRLPNEYTDGCQATSSVGDVDPMPEDPILPDPDPVSSEPGDPGLLLPFLADFDGVVDAGLYAPNGSWNVVGWDTGSSTGGLSVGGPEWVVMPDSVAERRLLLWYAGASAGSTNVALSTRLAFPDASGLGIAGLVANYRLNATATANEYWTAEISRPDTRLQLRRWTGTAWTELATVAMPSVAPEIWYTLSLTVEDLGGGVHRLTAEAYDAGILVGSVTTDTSAYDPGTGLVGLGTDLTAAAFTDLRVEAYP